VGPEQVLDLVDRKVNQFELGTIATVACAVSAPPYNRLTIALAGHPPPIVAVPGERALIADIRPSPPIGTYLELHRQATTIDLPPNTVVAFYTDGLFERRGEKLDVGLELLRNATVPGPPDRVAAQIMRQTVGDRAGSDDVALIVVRRIDANATESRESSATAGDPDAVDLLFSLPCDERSAALARRHVENFTARQMLGGLTDVLATIATELVTNAVVHGGGPVTMRLRRERDGVTVEVADGDPRIDGVQVKHPGLRATGGRGLLLVAELADDWGTRPGQPGNPSQPGKIVWATIAATGR